MRELSLFTGAGGGVLASKLLGWTTVGYVEINEYCQKVIRQRISDGILDAAPIFGDIRKFISEGYAGSYQGMVDVITAGFPCQPFSINRKGKAEADERNLWPETAEVIRRVRPAFAFLENVPNLLAHKYFGEILGSLAEMGYDCKWGIVGAGYFGTPHIRERIFMVAHPIGNGHAGPERHAEYIRENLSRITGAHGSIRELPNGAYWKERAMQSAFLGRSDVVADRSHRIRAIGNGQVPVVAASAWKILSGLAREAD